MRILFQTFSGIDIDYSQRLGWLDHQISPGFHPYPFLSGFSDRPFQVIAFYKWIRRIRIRTEKRKFIWHFRFQISLNFFIQNSIFYRFLYNNFRQIFFVNIPECLYARIRCTLQTAEAGPHFAIFYDSVIVLCQFVNFGTDLCFFCFHTICPENQSEITVYIVLSQLLQFFFPGTVNFTGYTNGTIAGSQYYILPGEI